MEFESRVQFPRYVATKEFGKRVQLYKEKRIVLRGKKEKVS